MSIGDNLGAIGEGPGTKQRRIHTLTQLKIVLGQQGLPNLHTTGITIASIRRVKGGNVQGHPVAIDQNRAPSWNITNADIHKLWIGRGSYLRGSHSDGVGATVGDSGVTMTFG